MPSIHTKFWPLSIAAATLLLLSSCASAAQRMVGLRPASRLPVVVEAYMEQYQPGPLPRLFQTTNVYDRNGIQIAELFEEGRRTWVGINDIAQTLLDATVATEDATFYTNRGIDPFRIAAAALSNAGEGRVTSGASTITMQLARNLFLSPDDRFDADMERKLLEAGLAQELTSLYTKDEILEMYLNLLNYGNLAYGPEAAAQTYFNKHAADLTRAEATFLAGIPQQPATLDPFRNFAAVKERQRIVLDLMVRRNYLSKSEADAIFDEELALNRNINPAPNLAPHFVQYLVDVLDARLGKNYTSRAGFNLYSTLDIRMQVLAQKLISQRVAEGKARYNMNNAALVALRPGTAEVLAMVGSADFNDDSIAGQVNVALMPRQPGSALKPVLYATAFDDLLISPATAMWDLPVAYDLGGGQFYRPQNYDNKFHGLVSARAALANSYNIPAVRLLEGLGMARALAGARALGVRSFTAPPEHYTLTLALGGHEVTLMDLVTAYHTIANAGRYVPPEVATLFLDSQNQPVTPLEPIKPVQAISPGAAFLTTDILSDSAARAPMFGANSALKLSKPAAAKTGTTTSFRDNWTIGFTRHLLVGVWVGNSNGQPMRDSTGISGAAPIWHDYMEAVLAAPDLLKTLGVSDDDPAVWAFTPPPDVAQRAECPPSLSCRKDGEYFTDAWLAATGADGPLADMYVTERTAPVHIDRAGNPYGAIYCGDPAGEERTLFRLGDLQGLVTTPAATMAATQRAAPTLESSAPSTTTINSGTIARTEGGQLVIFYYPDAELERLARMKWARSHGLAVNVGPCTNLAYYTVQSGEYWTLLARRFNVSVGDLQAANPHVLRSGDVLRPGDRLLVPRAVTITVGGEGEYYTVQAGDSWGAIATQFDVPLRLLQTVNPTIVRPYFILQPGDRLFIPAAGQFAGVER